MTNEQRMELLKLVFRAIFQSKIQNTDITTTVLTTNTGKFTGRWFKDSSTGQHTLRGFDFDCNLGDRILSLRCIEQNPNKVDNFGNLGQYAVLARQGSQIMWVINSTANKFLGRIQNGEWIASFVPATTPAPNNYNTPEHRAREDAAYAHIEEDVNNPNSKDIPGTAGTSMAASMIEGLHIDDLPEIPDGVAVPDYVYDQIADLDEPPEWDEYNE